MGAVTLGNFFSSGGKTVVGGAGGSGIDTESLVKALTEAKALPAVQLQDKIDINDKKSASLSEFKTLLGKLKDSVGFLRNPPGVGNAADNAFKYRTVSISSNTSIAGSEYVSATISPGAVLQSYTISDITSVAAAKKQSTGDINIATADTAAVSATPAVGEFKAGTFTLNGQNITLSAGESLNSVAAKFNAVSDDTGISASIIKISTGKYQLSFSATETGLDADFDFNNIDVVGTLVDASGVFSQITVSDKQDAANSVFTFNGAAITRQSSVISDIVDGVSLTIKKDTVAAPTTDITVAVEADATITKNSIINFVSAYNELKSFAAEQYDLNDDGTYKDTAVLHDDSLFRSTMTELNSQVSSLVSGLATGAHNKLSDIGVTLFDQAATTDTPQIRNMLTVDDSKLAAAIADDADAVRRVFEFDFTSDNTALRVFSRTNALAVSEFTLKVNPFATQTTETITVADADTAVVAASPTSNQFKDGVVTINGQAITLAVGDSLNTIVSKFEAVKATTGVSAALTTVSAGNYKITFTSTVTGTGKNFDLSTTALDPSGVFDNITLAVTGSYTATYDLGDGDVTVDVDATEVKNSTTGLVTSYSIKGKSGTALVGLTLVYATTTASVSNVTATQGIADKLFNVSDPVLTANTGSLAVALEALKDADTRLQDNIDKINAQVEVFRQQLLDKFARMEQAIASVNTLIDSIIASDNARNGAN